MSAVSGKLTYNEAFMGQSRSESSTGQAEGQGRDVALAETVLSQSLLSNSRKLGGRAIRMESHHESYSRLESRSNNSNQSKDCCAEGCNAIIDKCKAELEDPACKNGACCCCVCGVASTVSAISLAIAAGCGAAQNLAIPIGVLGGSAACCMACALVTMTRNAERIGGRDPQNGEQARLNSMINNRHNQYIFDLSRAAGTRPPSRY